jgi:hypothetical protein
MRKLLIAIFALVAMASAQAQDFRDTLFLNKPHTPPLADTSAVMYKTVLYSHIWDCGDKLVFNFTEINRSDTTIQVRGKNNQVKLNDEEMNREIKIIGPDKFTVREWFYLQYSSEHGPAIHKGLNEKIYDYKVIKGN